jgi:hypothetical protein
VLVYLREDLTVCDSPFEDAREVFSSASEEWRAFCREELGFSVPDWEIESERVRSQVLATPDP